LTEQEKHSEMFDAYYYAHGCGHLPYERNQAWLDSFGEISDRIIRDIQPGSVLDAGCALGFLVEGLRKRSVDAFGVDISEFAIENVHESIKPYCAVASISEPLQQSYDLIVSIEVLEHMSKGQAEKAVANLCQHTDDILFSSSPYDYEEATHFNVQPPEYWTAVFARHGFYRDVDYDASYITPWTVRYRRLQEPVQRVVAAYERKHWLLLQENHARRQLNIELRQEISEKDHEISVRSSEMQKKYDQDTRDLEAQLKSADNRLAEMLNSQSWRLIQRAQRIREKLIPPASRREDAIAGFFRALRVLRREGLRGVLERISSRASWRMKMVTLGIRYRLKGRPDTAEIKIPAVVIRPEIQVHQSDVDIVVCVYNALPDVQRCLASVLKNTSLPYRLIIVDDGSQTETRDFLSGFASEHGCVLLRNEQAGGYTRAANLGMRNSTGDYVLLLNSDTIVTPRWLDRMIACTESDDQIGIVGPLSNTASYQSIPEFESTGDWAENPLPEDLSIDEMGALVAGSSARLYPEMTFLNGFCLMIRRGVIVEVGTFDEDAFGEGYGEENDYCLRVRKAGYQLALADDTYIFHAQSRSYNHEKRRRLSQRAAEILAQRYGQAQMDQGVRYLVNDRVFEGIRARTRQIFERRSLIQQGQQAYKGRKVLFVLPIKHSGGGSNIVMKEALAMLVMGVDVSIFNFRAHRTPFEEAYPGLDLPVIYGEIDDIAKVSLRYDAVVATFNPSVAWIAPAAEEKEDLVVGYYAQDFEPMFYPPESDGYRQAWDSYTLIPNMVRFVKTPWTQQKIETKTGGSCHLAGPSMDVDLFVPRPRETEWPDRPLRVGAMIRPASLYRAPELTMGIFERLSRQYGHKVEIRLFGCVLDDPNFARLPQDFPWLMAGILGPQKVSNFLNELDVFVDYSSHQAMGLTAMEAMSCGVAVIVPKEGGAASFARHEENCLMVDTMDRGDCWQALVRLIDDHQLRTKLQKQAIRDMPQYYPEGPALKILKALFGE